MMRRITLATLLISVLMLPCSAWAQNTTSGGAYSITPSGGSVQDFLSNTFTERWYKYQTVAGRSYCVETQAGDVNIIGFTVPGSLDTFVTVIGPNGVTVLTSNDDAPSEPLPFFLSRACFIANATQTTFVKVTRVNSGEDFAFSLRVSDTTLFSNWFFVGSDYSAFTLIRNTTFTSLPYTVNWRNSAGTIVATTSSTLLGNGSIAIDARAQAGALAAGSGTVEIVHTGSPDAIEATTTVLSGTTGLSFDAKFLRRSSS